MNSRRLRSSRLRSSRLRTKTSKAHNNGERKCPNARATSSLFYLFVLVYAVAMAILMLFYTTKMDQGIIQSDLLSRSSFIQTSANKNRRETSSNKNKRATHSPYAYSWLLGSIHEDRKAYKGFLYNILIAAKVLREKGSTADFVLWAQLSPESKLKGRLPDEDERLLRALGVEIRMLDTVEDDSFAQIVYEKFRLLTMTEYNRVIFLDGDLMPRSSLDYLFHLSDPKDESTPLLRPNLILATKREPCNTAMFMVEPSDAGWKLLQDTRARQHEEGVKLPYPHFNRTTGWGYNFIENEDPWISVNKKSWKWGFHAAHSDLGLMYHWAKFGMKDTSIIIAEKLQNFVPGKDGKHKLDFEGDFLNAIQKKGMEDLLPPEEKKIEFMCWNAEKRGDAGWFLCNDMPYKHFIHFSGDNKPWQHGLKKESAQIMWFDHLKQLNDKYDMGLDVDNWKEKHQDLMQESPFGYTAKYTDHEKIIQKYVNSTKPVESEPGATNIVKDIEAATMGALQSFKNNFIEILNPAKSIEQATPRVTGSNTISNVDKPKAQTVAYVVSFIKCEDRVSNAAGLVDASLVMRHSIHQNSVRNPNSGSKYDYKMYAIVHRDAKECFKSLKRIGFEIIPVDSPVKESEIRGEYLRKNIRNEFCCGSEEFIKLYAYNKIPEEIFVHVDIDFAFYKPMDHLFDAILYSKESEQGRLARSKIERERGTDPWPDQIDAFITRDWHQAAPNKFPPGYQAGFIVGRHNPEVFDEMIEVIKEGNYSEGWGWTTGWGNKGYGGYVGAMAMQGFVAYYYDHIRPNTTVELNQCRYNHMGLDVRYNSHPNFSPKYGKPGQCRNNNPEDICEDCMVTESEKIYSVHYTQCRKPWQCMATGFPKGKRPGGPWASAINTDVAHLDHCMMLLKKWHSVRLDLEDKLFGLTGDSSIMDGRKGTYNSDVFLGHCTADGNKGYIRLSGTEDSYDRLVELYDV